MWAGRPRGPRRHIDWMKCNPPLVPLSDLHSLKTCRSPVRKQEAALASPPGWRVQVMVVPRNRGKRES